MSTECLPLTLIIPSDLQYLGVIRAFVEAVCRAGRFDAPTTNAIVLAANEAASNVIRHAHRDHPELPFRVECRLEADGIELTFIDEGKPFDLCAVPNLNPAEIRVGGRGVYLMRTLMDELSCERVGGRENVLRMRKRCRRAPPDEDGVE
jgi:serine/threonine-protein kinase RsbW